MKIDNRFLSAYPYESSQGPEYYFIIHNPFDKHNAWFYLRKHQEKQYVAFDHLTKMITVVFGRGANGKGLVCEFRWFW